MLLVLDNYDSFTYNLVQFVGELGADIQVFRNNAISLDEIEQLKPKHIIIYFHNYRIKTTGKLGPQQLRYPASIPLKPRPI